MHISVSYLYSVTGSKNQGHNIIVDLGFKLVANLLKENRNVHLEFIVGVLVEGKLAVRTIDHLCINTDTAVMIIEKQAVQPLPIILPYIALIREHLPDELRELGLEGDGLADVKVTYPQ